VTHLQARTAYNSCVTLVKTKVPVAKEYSANTKILDDCIATIHDVRSPLHKSSSAAAEEEDNIRDLLDRSWPLEWRLLNGWLVYVQLPLQHWRASESGADTVHPDVVGGVLLTDCSATQI